MSSKKRDYTSSESSLSPAPSDLPSPSSTAVDKEPVPKWKAADQKAVTETAKKLKLTHTTSSSRKESPEKTRKPKAKSPWTSAKRLALYEAFEKDVWRNVDWEAVARAVSRLISDSADVGRWDLRSLLLSARVRCRSRQEK